MSTPKSRLLEQAEWYQGRYATTLAALKDAEKQVKMLTLALERIRDCDFVISLPDRMDAVRKIAREALQ